jgi:starch synthase
MKTVWDVALEPKETSSWTVFSNVVPLISLVNIAGLCLRSRPECLGLEPSVGGRVGLHFCIVRVLFVTSEVHPFSKTGGLADVAGALPPVLVRQGTSVTVISPWYANLSGTPHVVGTLTLEDGDAFRVGRLELDGVQHIFIGSPDFDRPNFYGYDDDVRRFARFCVAVPRVAGLLGLEVDAVHLNDWQTGLLAPILRSSIVPRTFDRVGIVYTIHNLQYQGRWNIPDVLSWTGLPGFVAGSDGLEFHHDASAAKAGMVFCDAITTVSPTYAHEVQTPAMGFGMDGVLRERGVTGVLNGLDTAYWNPAQDAYLKKPYRDLRGKAVSRAALVTEFSLEPSRPILAMVTRLADQKGLDLLMAALPQVVNDWNLVVLGSGEARYRGPLEALARFATGTVAFDARFNEALAHRIYAGADAFLMPSFFEPCGLSQMISMRYGTVPIVRRTGGLADTVPESHGYGFQAYSEGAMLEALGRARADWGSSAWRKRVRVGMASDFGWDAPARAYLDLYGRLRRSG